MSKFCIICSKAFNSTNPKQKYCYQPCSHKNTTSSIYPQFWGDSCCACGNRAKFLSHRSFCSIECREIHFRRVIMVTLCKRCSDPIPQHKREQFQEFCTIKCKKEYESMTHKDWEKLSKIRSQLRREMYQSHIQDLRSFMKSLFLPIDSTNSNHSKIEDEVPS